MQTLRNLILALSSLIAAGTLTKIISLAVQMAFSPDDKGDYIHEIKQVLIVFICSTVIASGSFISLLLKYFK
ncbi:MAG: hypothetical protein RSE93_02185 [Oscillospiraceae bacterium]